MGGGALPPEADTWLNMAAVIALGKPDGGVRPIALLQSFRTLTLRAVARFFGKRLGSAGGPSQFGLGEAGGADLQYKLL